MIIDKTEYQYGVDLLMDDTARAGVNIHIIGKKRLASLPSLTIIQSSPLV
jgi:hypothetical protein